MLIALLRAMLTLQSLIFTLLGKVMRGGPIASFSITRYLTRTATI